MFSDVTKSLVDIGQSQSDDLLKEVINAQQLVWAAHGLVWAARGFTDSMNHDSFL